MESFKAPMSEPKRACKEFAAGAVVFAAPVGAVLVLAPAVFAGPVAPAGAQGFGRGALFGVPSGAGGAVLPGPVSTAVSRGPFSRGSCIVSYMRLKALKPTGQAD
eukprot:scaffold3036_cov414-Prasinococcus_capsulatus_cf.AAC.33